MIDLPSRVSKIIKKNLSKKNSNLYLKVTHVDDNVIHNLKLEISEKKVLDIKKDKDKVFADMTFGPYETDALVKKVKENFKSTEEMTMSEIPEFIDLSFLYEMDIEKIKNKFSDSAFKDDNNEIHIIFDIENNWLNVFVNDNKIEFC
ncbi:MAG TPA: hypothetical protein DCY94_01885, partial [Firmicutes bacterium]|nr:hypothetical protein [Bacillota bacterium]